MNQSYSPQFVLTQYIWKQSLWVPYISFLKLYLLFLHEDNKILLSLQESLQ